MKYTIAEIVLIASLNAYSLSKILVENNNYLQIRKIHEKMKVHRKMALFKYV